MRSSFSHCWDMQLRSICSRHYMAIAFAPETLLQKPQRAPRASFIAGFPYHHCRKSSFTSASPVVQYHFQGPKSRATQPKEEDRFRAVISFPKKERRRFNASCFSTPSLAWQPQSSNRVFVGTATGARCPREQWWGCPA